MQGCNEKSLKRAQMLADMHFRDLRQMMVLQMRIDEASRQIQTVHLNLTAHHCEEFVVPEEFMGLAIGSGGANIRAARDVDGVVDIEVPQNGGTIKVYAEVRPMQRLRRCGEGGGEEGWVNVVMGLPRNENPHLFLFFNR